MPLPKSVMKFMRAPGTSASCRAARRWKSDSVPSRSPRGLMRIQSVALRTSVPPTDTKPIELAVPMTP